MLEPNLNVGPHESLECYAGLVLDAQDALWQAQWAMRDLCLALRRSGPPGLLRALREPTGISEQKLNRWADEAFLIPPERRARDRAPIIQVREERGRLQA